MREGRRIGARAGTRHDTLSPCLATRRLRLRGRTTRLALESATGANHEYVNGVAWAMARATPAHARVIGTVVRALRNALERAAAGVTLASIGVTLARAAIFPRVEHAEG